MAHHSGANRSQFEAADWARPTRGTPQEVDAEVKERIRVLAPGGGYCVGSSNSVTAYVPFENFMAMREAAFKYGRYPIRV